MVRVEMESATAIQVLGDLIAQLKWSALTSAVRMVSAFMDNASAIQVTTTRTVLAQSNVQFPHALMAAVGNAGAVVIACLDDACAILDLREMIAQHL